MRSKAYTTLASQLIILIAGVVAAGIVATALLVKVGDFTNVLSASTQKASLRASVEIRIVHATLTSSVGGIYNYTIYVKNVGLAPLSQLENLDVYFGTYTTPKYIAYSQNSIPGWYYVEVEGNTPQVWEVQETIAIIVLVDQPPSNPMYVKVVTHNGVSSSYIFNVPG